MITNEELLELSKAQPGVSPQELARNFSEGSLLMRLVGMLAREIDGQRLVYASMEIVSDEGRLNAIKEQGRMTGHIQFVDRILDLVIEGQENDDRTEQSNSE